ncbi:WD40 repeat-like protein [Paxillus ammoniavirescens]|nr:WD40 repeat-like protein [Paxillus ammoniavirescens]
MDASPCSVLAEIVSVPTVVSSDSSQSMTLKNANHPVPVQVLEGHEGWVACVCFYADESKLVSGSSDKTLRIWDRKTGAARVLSGHAEAVLDVDVSWDGKMVVSGSKDKTVRIWNGDSGEMRHVFEGHEGDVRSVQFSPNSSRVVSGSEDGTVRVWSVETGELLFKPMECHGTVWCVRYSTSGDRIASAGVSVQIWDAETGIGIFSIRKLSVTAVAWTADSTYIIGGGKGEVTVWNSYDGEQSFAQTRTAQERWITTLSLSPNATHLATSNLFGKTAFISDISTGGQVATLEHDGHVKGIAFSPSGQLIATACSDAKLYLWEAPPSQGPKTISPAPSFSTFLDRPAIPGSPRSDGRRLDLFWDSLPDASLQPQRIFDRVRNTLANIFTRRPADTLPTTPVREIVETVEVAAGRDRPFWIVLERITWTPMKKMIFMLFFCRQPGPRERGGFAPINRDTRPNSSRTRAGNAAATKNRSGRPETGHGAKIAGARPVSSLPIANNPVTVSQPERTTTIYLSGEGLGSEPRSSATPAPKYQIHNHRRIHLIGARCTGDVYQMNPPEEECLKPHDRDHPLPLASVDMHRSSGSVSPEIANVPSDSSQLVSPKNASHPVPVQILEGHESWVSCVCFYVDENKLVSGSMDKTLRIWDRKTGATQVLSGPHIGWVQDVDVSRDGKMVVSGSVDKTIGIWNGQSGEMMHVCEGHKDVVCSVKFSPNSTRIVSGSGDNTIRVWSVETGELVFEPIECYGEVLCVRYSPSGDRIASGADGLQIWSAETGSGILSIRKSSVWSLAWTADGKHIIGGGYAKVTIWNSEDGGQLWTWKAHDDWITGLSLSPTATHLVTSNWDENTAFIFNVSTGEQVAALENDGKVQGVAFSPSGQLIATVGRDTKLYLWEAPVSEDPKTTSSPPSSFSSFLDQPAILAKPSRNDSKDVDLFWDDGQSDLPRPAVDGDQRTSSRPQQAFNKVRNTLANVFTRRPAGAMQNSPVRETIMIELADIAAGKDRPYAATIAPPKFNRVQKILYTIIHCRKPDEEEEEEVAPLDTAAGSSHGPAGKTVIDTQPQRSEMIAGPSSAPCTIPKASKASGSAQSTHPQDLLSPPVAQLEVPSFVSPPSTSCVTAVPPSTSPSISRPVSARHASQHKDLQSGNTLSPEEVALIQQYRYLKDTSESVDVELVAKPTLSNTPRPTPQPLLLHEQTSSLSESPRLSCEISPPTSTDGSAQRDLGSDTQFFDELNHERRRRRAST